MQLSCADFRVHYMQTKLSRRRGLTGRGRGGEKEEDTGLPKENAQSTVCLCMKMPRSAFVHYKMHLYFCLFYNLYSSTILMSKDYPTRPPQLPLK